MATNIAMSRSVSEPRFVILGVASDRRVTLFQEALRGLGLAPAACLGYVEFLAALQQGRRALAEMLGPGTIVRIESPGKDIATNLSLLTLGATAPDPDGDGCYARLPPHTLAAAIADHGWLWPVRQWYLGFCACLHHVATQIEGQRVLNPPVEIAEMFDKRATHARLAAAGLPVPPALPPIAGYADLRTGMRDRRWSSVFIKLAHGSSASGAVAYRTDGTHHQAITTVEMVRQRDGWRLYNTRRLRNLRDERQIADLIDCLARERVHVERWLPKASIAGQTYDLRVLTIAGRPRHTVARLSHSPMTNLHLLNTRGDLAAIHEHLGEDRWQALRATCAAAATLYQSLAIGVDIMVTTNRRHHAVLELNAFGDLLPRILDAGEDSYTAEIREVLAC